MVCEAWRSGEMAQNNSSMAQITEKMAYGNENNNGGMASASSRQRNIGVSISAIA